ncbi:hypothetical protein [Flavobacterium filum]|uniref:hypothetical protein n=1 Tax=Flavobacterium filum TaxID=370974 RepID=UPI0023F130C0|nr:hypothetical protein [Flavobacterium filum]
MRQLITTIFLLTLNFVCGQEFTYPSIINQGKDIDSFIPNGWTLLDSTRGDLNNDNQNDLVLIIQYKDSVTLINNEFDYKDTVLTQPRILIILFQNKETNQYQLLEQSNSFILNHDNPEMEDPYQDISISNGFLKIDFQISMNMDGWGMSNNSYKFRYQDNQFVLIGADYNSVNQCSRETEDRSYDFLTQKVKVAKGTIESKKKEIEWWTIDIKELKTIKTFKQPFTWEVEKGFYL